MNSVDFKLDIVVKEELGYQKKYRNFIHFVMSYKILIFSGLPEKIGYLYVNGFDTPFSSIKVTRSIRELNGKIIECKWGESGGWEFMRERTDKSYPNHMRTAMSVCDSIKNPITEENLTEIIQNMENKRMPPPSLPPPGSTMTQR